MTEEEKIHLRNKKEAGATELKRLVAEKSVLLEDTDRRIGEYLRKVSEDPEGHNLYEILGCVRYFDIRERYGWNIKRVRNFFKFYETLKFNGAMGRRKYKLTPIQCFQFASIFGPTTADGERLVRTAYIFVPRKFSKTTSAASLAVYDMLFGDYNAQAYVGANSYEQAKICFDEIRAIMRDIDPSEKTFKVNREKITFRNNKRDSFIRCLTANAKTQDGLNASLVIMDEYSQARNTKGKNGSDLKNVLTSSMGVRKSPLTLIITTASEVIDGPFAHELEGVQEVLRGEKESDTMFASIFMPDVDDREDDPRTWKKVQPHLGITVQEDFYAKEYETAQLSAENMLAFRTKLLNMFVIAENRVWFSNKKAMELLDPDFDINKVKGMPTAVSFDLSVRDDFSAVSYAYYNLREQKFYCHTDYYFPKGALKTHVNRALYELWAEQGHLKLLEGDAIDVKAIASDIIGRAKHLDILKIGYDSYKSQELTTTLISLGGETLLEPYRQTMGAFNLPVETFEIFAWSKPMRIALNNNPINAYCLCNCVIEEDRLENRKPMKAAPYRKIDGTITMLMCLGIIFSSGKKN